MSKNDKSAGDCRIVNATEAIKRNSNIRIYRNSELDKWRNPTYHIITTNENNLIIDKSTVPKGQTSLEGIRLSLYEGRTKNSPTLIYSNKKTTSEMKLSEYIFIYHFWVYEKVYRIFHM